MYGYDRRGRDRSINIHTYLYIYSESKGCRIFMHIDTDGFCKTTLRRDGGRAEETKQNNHTRVIVTITALHSTILLHIIISSFNYHQPKESIILNYVIARQVEVQYWKQYPKW